MYVAVKYEQDGKWSNKEYTYKTDLNLCEGVAVIAPTAKNPKQLAIISRINLPEPTFKCKEITELWKEDENAGD